jgi:hypothetical protein
VQVRALNWPAHALGGAQQQHHQQHGPERVGQPGNRCGDRQRSGGGDQQRRAAATESGEKLHCQVPGVGGQCHESSDDAGDPDSVAAQQLEQVRLRGVEPPDRERAQDQWHARQRLSRPGIPGKVDAGLEHLAHLRRHRRLFT